MARKMIELPFPGRAEYKGRIYLNPSRIQSIEVHEDHIDIKMNIPNMVYTYHDEKFQIVVDALIMAEVLPLPSPTGEHGKAIQINVQTTLPGSKEKKQ